MDKPFNLARAILTGGRCQIELPFEEFNRRDTEGFYRRDLTADDPAKTGYYLVNQRIPDVLDALRPVSLIGQLPITVLSGLSGAISLPRVGTGLQGSTAMEYGSGNATSESDITFGAPGTLRPLRLTVYNKFSRQLLAQGATGISDLVKRDIAYGLAQQLDNQLINGNGLATGQANGILNQVSGNTTSFTFGAAAAWPAFLVAQNQLEAAYVRPDHWVIGTATAKKVRNVLRGTSAARLLCDVDPICPDIDGEIYMSNLVGVEMIGKYPVCVTPYLSTEQAVLGQWNLVYILIWGAGIELTVDPFSAANTGEIAVVGNLMYNICLRHPAALAISTDAGNQ
jgi:HK97 family phage major capsid protein